MIEVKTQVGAQYSVTAVTVPLDISAQLKNGTELKLKTVTVPGEQFFFQSIGDSIKLSQDDAILMPANALKSGEFKGVSSITVNEEELTPDNEGNVNLGILFAGIKISQKTYQMDENGIADLSDMLSEYQGQINLQNEFGRNVLSYCGSFVGTLVGNASESTCLDGNYIQLGADSGSNITLNGQTFICAGSGYFNVQAEQVNLRGNLHAIDSSGSQTLISCGGGITIGNPFGWSHVEIYGYDSCGCGGVDLSNYQGPIHLADESGNIVIASNACGVGIMIGDICSGDILIFGNTMLADKQGNPLAKLSERQIIFGDQSNPECTEINFYGYSNKF